MFGRKKTIKTKIKKDEITLGKVSLGYNFSVRIPKADANKTYTLVATNDLIDDIIFTGVSGKLLQDGFNFKMDEE